MVPDESEVMNFTDVGNSTHVVHQSADPFVMIFLFGGLALGLTIQAAMSSRRLKKFIRLPYTVILLLIGLGIGVVIQATAPNLHRADEIFDKFTMVNTNPHLIMYIFLPILIFDSSFKMEAHSVWKAAGQIVVLAGPGLLLTTGIIGASLYGIMNVLRGIDEWTIELCLLVGSILSATDPVAVVSLLREMGACKEIVILTEGESLFNDGSAIIVFDILLMLSQRSLHIPFEGSLYTRLVLQLSGIIIAPAIGWIGGKVCEILLRKTFNNEIREKGIILVTVYATFFICEQIHVSGVLALCIQGIWLSLKKHSISPVTMEDNNKFWEFFNYWANTLIFILAGMFISKPIWRNGKSDASQEDYWIMLGVYCIMNVARGISVLVLSPFVTRMGYGLPLRHGIALMWGGLRGAIALLLALKLSEDPSFVDYKTEISDRVLLYVSGSVAMTLFINATTFGSMVKFFRLDEIPQHKLKVVKSALAHLQGVQMSIISQVKEDRFLAEADWDLVEQLSTITSPYNFDKLEELEADQKEANIEELKSRPSMVDTLENALREEARLRILQVERVSYWQQFARGLLSNRAISVLSDAVEHATETPGADLKVEALKNEWKVSPVLMKFQQILQEALDVHLALERVAEQYLPDPGWRRNLYRFLHKKSIGITIFFLMLGHAAIVFGELSGLFSKSHNNQLRLTLFALYCIFLSEIILNIIAAKSKYFKRKINWIETVFGLLYLANLFALLANLRQKEPSVYFLLEIMLMLRLLRAVAFLPLTLPKLLALVNHKIHEQVGLAYDTAKGFIIGEEETSRQVRRLIEHPKLADEFMDKCKKRRLEAIKHLAQLQVKHPGAAISVKTKQAAQFCLNTMQDALGELKESGIVDESEHKLFDKLIEEYMLHVKLAPAKIDCPELETQLKHFSWIQQDPDLIDFILRHNRKICYEAGQVVMQQGSPPDGLYILASGMCKVLVEKKGIIVMEEYMFAGRYFGEMGIITAEMRSATILAEVPCVVYYISADKMRKAFLRFKHIYWQFIRSYCISKSSDLLQSSPAYLGWTDVKLKAFLSRGHFFVLDPSHSYKRKLDQETLILVRGSVRDEKSGEVFEVKPSCMVLPSYVTHVSHIGKDPSWLFSVPPNNQVASVQDHSQSKTLDEQPVTVLNGAVPERSPSNASNISEDKLDNNSLRSPPPGYIESNHVSVPNMPKAKANSQQYRPVITKKRSVTSESDMNRIETTSTICELDADQLVNMTQDHTAHQNNVPLVQINSSQNLQDMDNMTNQATSIIANLNDQPRYVNRRRSSTTSQKFRHVR